MLRRHVFVTLLMSLFFLPIVSLADDGATMFRDYVKAKSPGIFVIMPNGDMRVGPFNAHHHDLAGGAEKVKDCVRGLIQVQDGRVVIQWFPPLNEMQRGNLRWINDTFVKDFLERFSRRADGLKTVLSSATLQLPLAKGGTRDIPLGQLLDGGDEFEKRLVRILQESGQITPGEANETVWTIDEGQEMKPRVAEKVKKARKEVMAISAGAQVDLERKLDVDRLMEDWRTARPNAQLQSPTPELKKVIRDIKDTPSGELKMLGLREPEIKFQSVIKERLEKAPIMQGLREKLPLRLEKQGLHPRLFQSKLREIMFNPSQLQLGDAGSALGGFDVGASVAAGLVQTYDILFNRSLSPEDENLELGNAWVTTLPVVGDFAQGLITGGQGWYEGDKEKLLEAGLWISIGVMGCVPGGQLPAVIASISLATKPLAAGVYDARQAQNLVQAWIESGDWAMDRNPRILKGLIDREGRVHAITYEDLLTEKGDKPYKSEMADGLLGRDVTINDSIRSYAEKYVMPQYKALASLRDGLKSLYPDFDDKIWKDEFTAKYKIEARGGKGGLALFNTYYLIRTKAFQQTIVQLKSWAEDEMRAAKDYDAEVDRLKHELQVLQDELKCSTLIRHADDSVAAYSRVIKNLWEQESLALSKLRIYEHYVKTYSTLAGKLQRVNDLFRECSAPYIPSSWHLTGFPEFDVDRVDTLLVSMENGRKGVIEHIEKLLRDFDQPVTKYDSSNQCHKKAFDVLAPLRYKVAFVENLILYYKQLAKGSSTWTRAYDSAAARYKESRDGIATSYKGKTLEIVFSQRFIDSFMTYVASIPYSLASGESDLYQRTASDYEIRLPGDRKEYEMATWMTGTGGKALQGCLLSGLDVELTLSTAEPEEGKDIVARVRLAGGTPPKENYWHWKTSGGLSPSSRSGEEITLRAASEGTVTVELLDHFNTQRAKVLASATASVKPKKRDDKVADQQGEGKDGAGSTGAPAKWKFSGVSPGNWTAAYTEKGIRLERAPAKIKGPCGWDSSVTASVWAEFPTPVSAQNDPKSSTDCLAAAEKVFQARRQGDTPNDMAVGLSLAGGVEGAKGFSLGDFKGAIADFALWMRRGSGGMFGYNGSYFGASGRGSAVNKSNLLRFGYSVAGGGCWDNSDRAYLLTQGVAAQAEARTILSSLRLGADGDIKQEPYKGPKYDGSDLPKVTISPSILEKLRVGDTVQVAAEVHNDKPEDSPFTYNWGGTFDGTPEASKSSAAITIKPQKPGTYDLSVSVDGQRFNMGSASLQYTVADYKVMVERVPLDTNPVTVGVKTGFKATLTMDGQPAVGPFIYRWQPHPEVSFDQLDSQSPAVNALFAKPGRVKVWVQVLEMRDGRQATVAESDQLEIEVIRPQLELTFEPKEPFVGQQVKAKLVVKPEVKEIDFRWLPVPANANQGGTSRDGREITFSLRDDRSAEIQVSARVPHSGEDLGQAKGTIRAKKYSVNVTGPKVLGPTPQVWKEGIGLVDVDNAIAVDQIVEFSAEVQPQPLTGPVKYEWRHKNGACRVSNPTSREARVTAGEAGTCDLVVVVRDNNNIVLGEGQGTFSATVTREMIGEGKQKAKNVQEAKGKVNNAREKARKGDYEGAIADAEAAAVLNPSSDEAKILSRTLRQDKQTMDRQLDKARALMAENRFAEALKEFIGASNISSFYKPVQGMYKELKGRQAKYDQDVRQKMGEMRDRNERKDFAGALETARDWRASTKLDPYADKELKAQEDWAQRWQEQKERQLAILKSAGDKVRACDYAGSLEQFEKGFANGQNIFRGQEPEYKKAIALRGQALTKNKKLQQLTPWIRKAAEDQEYMTVEALRNSLKTADEAIILQPNNPQLKAWRALIVARIEKTRAENDRIAQGRKHLEAAGKAERSFLNSESAIKARQIKWGEKIELEQQANLATAITHYRQSLAFIFDVGVEKKIKELETTLAGRNKLLENYRLSNALKKEAEELHRQAMRDPDIRSASSLYEEAAEKYRKSLALYRPFNAEMIERTILVLETTRCDRWVKQHWADGQALEKAEKPEEALARYDAAIASFHPTVPYSDRLWIVTHAQNLRNRLAAVKQGGRDAAASAKSQTTDQSHRYKAVLVSEGITWAQADRAARSQGGYLAVITSAAENETVYALVRNDPRFWHVDTYQNGLGPWIGGMRGAGGSGWQWVTGEAFGYAHWAAGEPNNSGGMEDRLQLFGYKRQHGAEWNDISGKNNAIRGYIVEFGPAHQGGVETSPVREGITAGSERTAPLAPASAQPTPVASQAPGDASSDFYLVDLSPYGGKKGSPRKARNIEVDDGSWIRLKATHEQKLRLEIPLPQHVTASAVAVVSNLDNAHYLKDGVTTTVLTVHTTAGDQSFEFKAGVHTSEWNRNETSGADHGFAQENHVGDKRWMAVFRLPAGSVVTGLRFDHRDTDKQLYHGGAAPGFCLRGITLIGSPLGPTAADQKAASPAFWVGTWKSESGPDGEMVTFRLAQSDKRLTGTFTVDVPYTSATGTREQTSVQGNLEGIVSGNRVQGTFREESDSGPTGTFTFIMDPAGQHFTAEVRGEENSSDSYTMRRSDS
jgi:hypothetical protein